MGQSGCELGIILNITNDFEPGNWVVRREIRANHRKSAPLWIHSPISKVPSVVEITSAIGSIWLGGTSLSCNQLLDNSKQISVHKCICELCWINTELLWLMSWLNKFIVCSFDFLCYPTFIIYGFMNNSMLTFMSHKFILL
jgi:hypothetical protein